MGPGWRKVIHAQHVGGIAEGCTHLREMLFNMATAAYQTIAFSASIWQRRELAGQPDTVPTTMTHAPYFLGQCHSHGPTTDPTVQRALSDVFQAEGS